ncbi:MAG TPA: hypothetical protein VG938_03715 [Verrucomicrobiae bacterium]|jgi:hypothetical protein|nr:hypothetical protein [Verrucomicrobiae bacterium]
MKKNNRNRAGVFLRGCRATVLAATAILLVAPAAYSQTTNAFDQASDPVYAGLAAPNGLFPGGQNGGTGFGPWTFTESGTGGAFIQTFGPSGDSFDLWNTSANSATVAARPFTTPLAAGQSFTVLQRFNSLDSAANTNQLALEDASGNILFSYWHFGNEANANNGGYSDALTNSGVATNFQYAYQAFETFTFTLTTATNYTFTDNSTGGSFTGIISNAAIAQVAFIRINGNHAPGNGQDYQFDRLKVTSSAPPTFSVTPAAGSLSAAAGGAISAQIVSGGTPLNINTVSLSVDGQAVAATTGGSSSLVNVSYTPTPALSSGSLHTARVIVQDNNSIFYTNSWSFTTGFTSLPVVLPGPFTVSSNVDLTIFTAAGEGWLGANYQSDSSKTLYARFSMEYNSTNDTPSTYTFGGFEFFQGNAEKFLIGKSGGLVDWSVAAVNGFPDTDIPPSTLIVPNDWHTFVVRVDYSPGGNATAQVWLDPDFTQTEANQPNAPLVISLNNTFDNIRIRSGFDDAIATYSNIVIAATSSGVGFVAPSAPQFQGYVPGINAASAAPGTPITVDVLLGTYGINTSAITMTVDGNSVSPTFTVGANDISVKYQPPSAFALGSTHNVEVTVTDSNNASYSTAWSFTVDQYPTLPVSQAGPFDVSAGLDVTLWTGQNGWIGTNYGPNSTNTLYTRFSMVFYDFPQTVAADGGSYGGLHFFQDNNERLLVGDAWTSTNWSADAKEAGEPDLLPVTPIVVNEWHTMVIRSVYTPNNPAVETIWLDPDFTKGLNNQPQQPLTVSLNNTFNQVRLRCGNGSTFAEYTNIVIAANSTDLGFPVSAGPGSLSIQSGQLSWTGGGTLQNAPALTGPWSDVSNQSNPQALSPTNAAGFFRLRQ